MARVQREEVGKAIQTEEARAELTQEQEQKRVKATPSPPVRQSVAMLQTPTLLQGLGKSFSSPGASRVCSVTPPAPPARLRGVDSLRQARVGVGRLWRRRRRRKVYSKLTQ